MTTTETLQAALARAFDPTNGNIVYVLAKDVTHVFELQKQLTQLSPGWGIVTKLTVVSVNDRMINFDPVKKLILTAASADTFIPQETMEALDQ